MDKSYTVDVAKEESMVLQSRLKVRRVPRVQNTSLKFLTSTYRASMYLVYNLLLGQS